MAMHLRVFQATTEESEYEAQTPRVHVRLGDLLPLIAAAQRSGYLWLRDFLDDDVAVTDDLYQVLRSFDSYRPSA
jgi:hypothetical protein